MGPIIFWRLTPQGHGFFWCLSATGLEVKRSSSRTAMGVHRLHLAFKGPTIITVWDFKRAVDVILDVKWIWGGLRHEMLDSMGPQQTWASLLTSQSGCPCSLLSELDTNFTLARSGGGAFCGSPMSLMPINFFDIGKFHTPYSFCHAKIFVPLNIILRPLFA